VAGQFVAAVLEAPVSSGNAKDTGAESRPKRDHPPNRWCIH